MGRWPGAWPTCRWGGDPRSYWYACGASPAPTAAECGDRTPPAWLSPRTRLTHSVVEWGLRALALECMSVSRIAAAPGISWHTANNAILANAQATLLDDPHRFDGVEVLGVDDSPARFGPVREVPPLCGATPSGATSTSPSSST